MPLLNPQEALGLPPGSVRAIIVLLIAGTVVFMAAVGKITADQFLPLATMAFGFYFLAAGNKEQSIDSASPEPEPEVVGDEEI